MRILIVLVISLLIFILSGCDNNDMSSRQPGEQQATVPAPKMDLHSAVVMGDLEIIRKHIDAGSDLNVTEPTRKSSPLITASVFGKTEAAKILIDAGADLDYKNNDGATALHSAAFFCYER